MSVRAFDPAAESTVDETAMTASSKDGSLDPHLRDLGTLPSIRVLVSEPKLILNNTVHTSFEHTCRNAFSASEIIFLQRLS